MSSVQLSSSPVERQAPRRTFPFHARTGACRSLFGPVDHDELNRDMKSKLREIAERDRLRWNFNFEADTPLSGEYEWEESAADSSPAFYRESVQSGRTRADRSSSAQDAPVAQERTVNQENRADRMNSGRGASRTAPTCARRKRISTRITDFYVKRRRTAAGKPSEGLGPHSSTSIPVEQTPRKRIR
ncbi:cyclin-dependent kinase inhibitor 1C [Denticeps clupeoides]|uniref:cyclin-dependent kinase inhibitor 1C n=1 Tax=Denticeps clupeoides TaxID=299321 RepID=UPI0010A4E912|nr:cyclin-dependent kinase inhibitor 1C-like [Denticeps clupeoides]